MAAKQRRRIPTLIESFYKEPFAYEFHQALMLLELMHPDAPSLGEGVALEKEVVRLKSRVYLSTSSDDLYSLEPADLINGTPIKLVMNFFGIAGIQGPLPVPYTELLLDRISKKDTALRDFLDIFNHRLASVLHRIRKKYWVGLDTIPADKSAIGQALRAFAGIQPESNQEEIGMRPRNLIAYTGLLWTHPRSGVALSVMLSDYFEVPVFIKPFKGRWLTLEPTQTTLLGWDGQFNTLGQGASLGTRVWDILTGITIKIGPLNEKKFREFLKNGSAYPALERLVKLFLPKDYFFHINLVMKGPDITPTYLGGKTALGWTSWLCQKPRQKDDAQVMLYPGRNNLMKI